MKAKRPKKKKKSLKPRLKNKRMTLGMKNPPKPLKVCIYLKLFLTPTKMGWWMKEISNELLQERLVF
jgi:hypothetical protein